MAMELDLGPSARAFATRCGGWLEADRPEELVGVDAERLAPLPKDPAPGGQR